ncbi:MAG: 50S ribosomal protein L3 N(5)-glutamine methyltransferase [Proteobacteria bacterium]|nr:50S ribosomal protein L3 N(5)-glutamine methyltransferase [Pseudomonadota bacterium]
MIDLLSQNKQRNDKYHQLLSSNRIKLKHIVALGNALMRKEGLHRHFFFKPTFRERLYGTTYMLPTAQYLAQFALNLSPENNNDNDIIITREEAKNIIHLYERRIVERIPVEYITHECWYLNRKFYVNQHVLVPRSLMSTQFDAFLNETTWENFRVLDLCTGSGCIGISLALMNEKISVDLADISIQALNVAQKNIENYHLQNRVKCIESDLFTNIHHQYDLIITNPPYVASNIINKGPKELKNEPRIALDGGSNGLDIIDCILMKAKNYLNPNGKLIAEVGFSAPKLLKKRYPFLKWLSPKPAKHEETIFDFFLYSGHCIFTCNTKDLQHLGQKNEY